MKEPLGLQQNHQPQQQKKQAGKKVCVCVSVSESFPLASSALLCCDLCAFFRAQHTCM